MLIPPWKSWESDSNTAIWEYELCKSKERIAIRENGLSSYQDLILLFLNPVSLQGFRSIVCVLIKFGLQFMHLYHYCFEQNFLNCIFN